METVLTPYEVVKPLVGAEQAATQWKAFEDLKKSLLTDDDYAQIQGKPYIKKSGFRKIAVFFGLSDTITHEERKDRDNGSFYWRIKAQVTAPNGRSSVGVGVCDSEERKFSHVEHDVYATAHTRAKNRAISDMVAGGLVSAEEMDPTPPDNPAPKKVEANTKVISKKLDAEESVAAALEANGLTAKGLVIYQYGNKIRVEPPKEVAQDTFNDYNKVLGYINGKWSTEQHRWEVPLP